MGPCCPSGPPLLCPVLCLLLVPTQMPSSLGKCPLASWGANISPLHPVLHLSGQCLLRVCSVQGRPGWGHSTQLARETWPCGACIPALGDRLQQARPPRCVWRSSPSSPALSAPTFCVLDLDDKLTSALLCPGQGQSRGDPKEEVGKDRRPSASSFPGPGRTTLQRPPGSTSARPHSGLLKAGPAVALGWGYPQTCPSLETQSSHSSCCEPGAFSQAGVPGLALTQPPLCKSSWPGASEPGQQLPLLTLLLTDGKQGPLPACWQ